MQGKRDFDRGNSTYLLVALPFIYVLLVSMYRFSMMMICPCMKMICMHENDISMHSNLAQKNFMGENSLHEDLWGRIFMFMHGDIISMHESFYAC